MATASGSTTLMRSEVIKLCAENPMMRMALTIAGMNAAFSNDMVTAQAMIHDVEEAAALSRQNG